MCLRVLWGSGSHPAKIRSRSERERESRKKRKQKRHQTQNDDYTTPLRRRLPRNSDCGTNKEKEILNSHNNHYEARVRRKWAEKRETIRETGRWRSSEGAGVKPKGQGKGDPSFRPADLVWPRRAGESWRVWQRRRCFRRDCLPYTDRDSRLTFVT